MLQPYILGDYLVLERLNIGGMAEIFKARHIEALDPSNFVVIKQILPHLAIEERLIEMFETEAELTAQFSHRNIPKCLDYSADGTTRFLVLEHVHGRDLVSICQRAKRNKERLPIELVLYLRTYGRGA